MPSRAFLAAVLLAFAMHGMGSKTPPSMPVVSSSTIKMGGNVLGGAAVKLSGQESDSALISSQRGTGRDHGGFGTLDSLEEDLDALLRVNPTSSSFVAAPDASTAGQDSSAWESSSFVMKLRLSKVVDLKAGETLWVAGNVRGLGGGQAADAGVQMVQFKPGDAHQLIVLIEPPQDGIMTYRYLIKRGSGVTWEQCPERRIKMDKVDANGGLAFHDGAFARPGHLQQPVSSAGVYAALSSLPRPVDSQPCAITLSVGCKTNLGDSLVAVGSHSALGSWDPNAGLAMRTSVDMYPRWVCEFTAAESNVPIRYKYIIKRQGGGTTWEDSIPDRVIEPSGETMSVSDVEFNEIRREATHLKLPGRPAAAPAPASPAPPPPHPPSPSGPSLSSTKGAAARAVPRPGSLSLPPEAERARRSGSGGGGGGVPSEADSWSLGEMTRERDRLESEVDEMERRKQAGDAELERAQAAAAKAVPQSSMMSEFEQLSVDVERANQYKVDAENKAAELGKALGEATAQVRQEENRLAEAEKELRTALALNRDLEASIDEVKLGGDEARRLAAEVESVVLEFKTAKARQEEVEGQVEAASRELEMRRKEAEHARMERSVAEARRNAAAVAAGGGGAVEVLRAQVARAKREVHRLKDKIHLYADRANEERQAAAMGSSEELREKTDDVVRKGGDLQVRIKQAVEEGKQMAVVTREKTEKASRADALMGGLNVDAEELKLRYAKACRDREAVSQGSNLKGQEAARLLRDLATEKAALVKIVGEEAKLRQETEERRAAAVKLEQAYTGCKQLLDKQKWITHVEHENGRVYQAIEDKAERVRLLKKTLDDMVAAHEGLSVKIANTTVELEAKSEMFKEREERLKRETDEVKKKLERDSSTLAQTIEKVSKYEEQVKVAENERNEALAAYDALEKTRSKDGVHKELEQVRRQSEEERKELSRYKAKLKEAREAYSKLMDSVMEKDVKTRKLEEMVFAAETETKLELKRLAGLSSVGIEEKVMRLQEELAAKEKDALRLAGEVDALMERAEMIKTTKEHQVQVLELSLARTQQIKKIKSDMEEKSMHSSGIARDLEVDIRTLEGRLEEQRHALDEAKRAMLANEIKYKYQERERQQLQSDVAKHVSLQQNISVVTNKASRFPLAGLARGIGEIARAVQAKFGGGGGGGGDAKGGEGGGVQKLDMLLV